MKMFALALLALILIASAAEAKTIVYVTGQTPQTEKCSDLKGDDLLFCSELEKLGYTVVAKNENAVITNAWKDIAEKSDLIFLGGTSEAVANTTNLQQNFFCRNVIYSEYSDLKITKRTTPVFTTGINSYRNFSEKILGCGAEIFLKLKDAQCQPGGACITASYSTDQNICKKHIFKKQKEGYVTGGLADVVPVYAAEVDAKISGKIVNASLEPEIWLADECTPTGKATDYFVYPAVFTTNRGVFWGPDNSSKFTNTTWKIFDRAVLYTLGDRALNASFFTIPESPSARGKFLILADVRDNNKKEINATASIWIGSAKYSFSYSNVSNLWEVRDSSVEKTEATSFFALSANGLKESNISGEIKAGEIKANILSQLSAGKNTTIRASLENAGSAAQVKYKIWSRNFSSLGSGEMRLSGGVYAAEISIGETNYILEVDAQDSGKSGGAYKEIFPFEKFEYGKDFVVNPPELYLSYPEGKNFLQKFSVKSLGANITGFRISKIGDISDSISFDLSNTSSSIRENQETYFYANFSLKGLAAKTYTGKIVLDADRLNHEIPFEIIIDPLIRTSDWFSVNPKTWNAQIPKGNEQAKNFSLISLGPYHASEIRFEGTGEFKNILSASEVPFVRAEREASVALKIDASKLSEGSHSGEILIFSTTGNDSISVNINIVGDFLSQIDGLEANISSLEARIGNFNSTGADTTAALAALEQAKASAQSVREKWNAQDYDGAKSLIPLAQQKISLLEKEVSEIKPPLPIFWIALAAIVIILALLIFKFRGKIQELFKKKKVEIPEEQPEEGGGVYAPKEGDEGYRPEYY